MPKMSKFHWSVDTMVVRDNVIFGFGWIFHENHQIDELRLRLTTTGEEGISRVYLSVDNGKLREDVGFAFATQPNAPNSGYFFYGAFPVGKKLESIDLLCLLNDGSFFELALPDASLTFLSDNKETSSNRIYLQHFVKRGISLIRAGKYKYLLSKVRQYIRRRPNKALNDPSDLAKYFREDERKHLTLIIDHDLGGGANFYRNRMVESIIQEGRGVIILTFSVSTLTYLVILKNRRIDIRLSIPDTSFFLEAVRRLSLFEIIYNTGASFVRPEEIPPLLINLKQITSARLKTLVHDYFIVCPSHFLIDHEGKYCNVPSIDVCSGCLPRSRGFPTLFVDQDMVKWREIWGSLLVDSDEIVTFSNSSFRILMRAYPKIDPLKISVIPHSMLHLKGKLPQISNTSALRIGVVGQIGFHKGSDFIQALAREIKRRKIDLEIIIIGTIEASCDSNIVRQTGVYEYEDLPALVERSGANVMLFSSIWPETFSYVLHELIDMGLPIASFNIGAPADRLSTYPKGIVLDSMDPRNVLNELISFHRELYHTH